MKRLVRISVLAVVFGFLLVGCTEQGNVESSVSSSSSESTQGNSVSIITTEIVTTEIEETTLASYTDEAGGNPEQVTFSEYVVTVSDDKYFVDNHIIDYDELLEQINALDDNWYVKIYDENSTLKAFRKLKEYLEENDIPFEIAVS